MLDPSEDPVIADSETLAEHQLNSSVVVPGNIFVVNDSTLEEICQIINPLTDDGKNGINLFTIVIAFLLTRCSME